TRSDRDWSSDVCSSDLFFWDEPKIYYMHVLGMGTPADLARKIKPALDLIGHAAPGVSEHQGPSDIVGSALDTKALDGIVGSTGRSEERRVGTEGRSRGW